MCTTVTGWSGPVSVDVAKTEALRLAAAWGHDRDRNDIVEAAAAFEEYLRGKANA